MGEAFLWGVVGGSSLVIGGAIARRVSLTARHMGLIMAFGAGVLISAVAYELVHEAFETSAGDGGIAVGLLAGSALSSGRRFSSSALRRADPPKPVLHRPGGRSSSESSSTAFPSRSFSA
jgi:ZIP family zinc transporter